MEEKLQRKRLGVFRAITRDYSPNSDLFSQSPGFDKVSNAECLEVSCPSSLGLEKALFPSLYPLNDAVFEPPFRHSIEPFSSKDKKKPEEPSASPFTLSKLKSHFYDRPCFSPLNNSGSFSNQNLTFNASTEESSREDTDERRKPKKRPLEEAEKGFYVIKIDAISRSRDVRTTVMIKNIPNKYTQKMLLQTINKKFSGTYNFLYLPIDFKVRNI